jgi:Leucine-rich repeat (LRR) protein
MNLFLYKTQLTMLNKFIFSFYITTIFYSQIIGQTKESIYNYGPIKDEFYIDFNWALKYSNEVTKLKLENTEIQDITKINKLKNLQVLRLQNNKLSILSDNLGDLSNLLYLEISQNPISTLPKTISKLFLLNELKIHKSRLQKLPNNFALLKNLKVLEIQNNSSNLKTDSALFFMPSLREILFYNTPFNQFPLGLQTCSKLFIITIVQCGIDSIPKSFFNQNPVKELVLANNQINEIPKEITGLKSLEILILKNNQIKNIPESLCFLKNLKTIDLSGNPIDLNDLDVLRILMPQTNIIF